MRNRPKDASALKLIDFAPGHYYIGYQEKDQTMLWGKLNMTHFGWGANGTIFLDIESANAALEALRQVSNLRNASESTFISLLQQITDLESQISALTHDYRPE